MPFVTIAAVILIVFQIFSFYGENNQGVEFFVDTEPEQGIVYVRARGNLSLTEMDALVRQVEEVVLNEPGVAASFAFAGDGGLSANTAGAQAPRDANRPDPVRASRLGPAPGDPDLRGQVILDRMQGNSTASPASSPNTRS
jgi:multidrug efflux pump